MKKWIGVSVAAGLFLMAYTRWGGELSAVDQVRYLPTPEGIFVQIEGPVIRQLAGLPGNEEKEYVEFVDKTGFDYRRDLDRVVAMIGPSGNYFAVKGRFNWPRIAAYAGNCVKGVCSMPASQESKWISLMMPRKDLLLIAVASSQIAVGIMETPQAKPVVEPASSPFYVAGRGKYFASWGLSGEDLVQARLERDSVVLSQGTITRRIELRKIFE